MTDLVPSHLRVIPDAERVNEVRCYKIREVADLTGLSESFLYAEINAGRLPTSTFGDSTKQPRRVNHRDLVEYIRAHREA